MHPPVKPLRMQALWERKNNEPPWVPALVNQPFILAPLSTTHSTSGAPPIPSAVAPFAHHENDMYEQGSVATVKTGNITHTSRRRRSAKPKSRAHAAAIDSPDQRLAFLLASIPLHWQPRRRSRWQIVHAGCRRPTSRGVPDPPPARPDRMAAVERPRGCTQKEKRAKKRREGEQASGSDDENRASTPGAEKRRQKSPLANRLRAGGRAARVWEASGTTKDTHLDWGVSTRRIWPSRSPWRVTTCATETVR